MTTMVDELRAHRIRVYVVLPAELLGTPISDKISDIMDETREKIDELMEGVGE
jgi:hypothetical protein